MLKEAMVAASLLSHGQEPTQTPERFVERYVEAWVARDPEAVAALWSPEGVLTSPLYDRPMLGSEIAELTRSQFTRNPDLTWTLIEWATHGETHALEFRNTFTVRGQIFEMRGVDWMRVRDGRIVEERVYLDTAPVRALRDGRPLEPVVRLPPAAPLPAGAR
jgi:ketosteroid isomerase-like protein